MFPLINKRETTFIEVATTCGGCSDLSEFVFLEPNQDYYKISEYFKAKKFQDKKEKFIVIQYSEKAYKLASDNMKYNADGKAVILENDEWRDEKEWDEVFEQLQKEQKNS